MASGPSYQGPSRCRWRHPDSYSLDGNEHFGSGRQKACPIANSTRSREIRTNQRSRRNRLGTSNNTTSRYFWSVPSQRGEDVTVCQSSLQWSVQVNFNLWRHRPRNFPTASRYKELCRQSAIPTCPIYRRYVYVSFAEFSEERIRGETRNENLRLSLTHYLAIASFRERLKQWFLLIYGLTNHYHLKGGNILFSYLKNIYTCLPRVEK